MTAAAEVLFWTAAFVLFYIYGGYLIVLMILAYCFGKTRKDSGYCPSLSFLIAAYNEEANIHRKLEETLALDYPADRLEILVVSDGSTDRTEEIVRQFTDEPVRLLRVEDRRGKTHAQNEGVKLCNGEVIVFSDATAVYHSKALRYLAAPYADPTVGAVSGRYRYFDPNGSSPTGLGSVAFWNYENFIKRFQSRIFTLTGCSGCIYSVRRNVYISLPDDACSDLVEPLHVVKQGYRVVFEERALAYEETTQNTTDEFRMRVRVATRGMRGVLSVPELLKFWRRGWITFQLLSHKILRWQMPFVLLTLLVTSAVLSTRPVYGYLFGLQLAFYAIALSQMFVPFHHKWKPLGLPLYICTLSAAALIGIVEVARGNKYSVWRTVRR